MRPSAFTLLAAFVHTLRNGVRDEVTEMFCKRMAAVHKKGRARLEALREEHRAESERLLEVFGDILAAAREAAEPAPSRDASLAHADSAAEVADRHDGQPAVPCEAERNPREP